MKEYTYTASVTVHDWPDVSTDERFGVADEIFDALETVPGLVVNSVLFIDANGDERELANRPDGPDDSDYEYGPPAARGCAIALGAIVMGAAIGWGLVYLAVVGVAHLVHAVIS